MFRGTHNPAFPHKKKKALDISDRKMRKKT
jgi:hypothetical protein